MLADGAASWLRDGPLADSSLSRLCACSCRSRAESLRPSSSVVLCWLPGLPGGWLLSSSSSSAPPPRPPPSSSSSSSRPLPCPAPVPSSASSSSAIASSSGPPSSLSSSSPSSPAGGCWSKGIAYLSCSSWTSVRVNQRVPAGGAGRVAMWAICSAYVLSAAVPTRAPYRCFANALVTTGGA